jgi:plastocyanin
MKQSVPVLFAIVVLSALALPARATLHQIQVGDFFFNPTKTIVSPGDTVRWILVSGIHTTTSAPGSPKMWDSGILSSSYDVVFTVGDGPGPFPYVCAVHPHSMIDTIFMAAAPADPTRFAFVLGESQAADCAGTGSSAIGYGLAVLSPDSSELSLFVVHDVASANMAHVHRGAPCTSGPIAYGFSSPASPISESWSLSPTDVQDLFNGNLYVNVHSPSFPSGEIQGQIVQDDIRFLFNLDESAVEGGGTGSFATGFCEGILSADAAEMSFTIRHDVSSPIDAHVHFGAPGVGGPAVFPFTSFTSPITGTWMLDTTDIKNLFTNQLYINVHSTAFPAGEIRGQVGRETARFAYLLTEAEADGGAGTGSSATGFAVCELSANQETMFIQVEHDIASAIDAHVHFGAAGVEGPVRYGFTSPASPAAEVWSVTEQDIVDLLDGNLYINIHSPTWPSGEIRGQMVQAPISLGIDLDESQANLCAGTGSPAIGYATVTLKPEARQVTVSATHNVSDATNMNIELGFPCIDGPTLFSLGSATTISSVQQFSTNDVNSYLRGELNVTVTSLAFPDGEIRGQVEEVSTTGCCIGSTGNVNDDAGGSVDLSDLIYLVNYLFLGGPSPACPASANVNGDAGCSVDLSDLIFLVNYLFLGGPPPAACDPAC